PDVRRVLDWFRIRCCTTRQDLGGQRSLSRSNSYVQVPGSRRSRKAEVPDLQRLSRPRIDLANSVVLYQITVAVRILRVAVYQEQSSLLVLVRTNERKVLSKVRRQDGVPGRGT